jgi:adenylate cyclase
LRKFPLGEQSSGSMLVLAAESDFVPGVQRSQFVAMILAAIAGAAFIPAVWIFGGRMARSLKKITAQAWRLKMLAAPDNSRSHLMSKRFTSSA